MRDCEGSRDRRRERARENEDGKWAQRWKVGGRIEGVSRETNVLALCRCEMWRGRVCCRKEGGGERDAARNENERVIAEKRARERRNGEKATSSA